MKKPRVIQEAIDCLFSELLSQERLLSLALVNAAERQKVQLSESEVKHLTGAILNAKGDELTIDLDPSCGLGQTTKDAEETLQAIIDGLAEAMADVSDEVIKTASEAIPDALAEVAKLVGDHLSKQAFEHALQLRDSHSRRADAVQCLWGPVIDQLDFIRHIVLEWNYSAVDLRKGAYSNRHISFALNRLVARAYEIIGEIIALTRAGYADGALARWRSLHEVCVVAIFIAKQSDRCAEMYLAHHCIEELRLLNGNKTSGTSSVGHIHRDRHIRNLRIHKAAMISRFGSAFGTDYGWASVELGRNKTTFRDLENHVGLETLRRGYQQANSIVHGGGLATLTRISLGANKVGGTAVPPAYGCEVAISYATASLSMMIAELCDGIESTDLLTMSLVIHNSGRKLREEINQSQKQITGDSPRARLLLRKAIQRDSRTKARPIFRKS